MENKTRKPGDGKMKTYVHVFYKKEISIKYKYKKLK